MVCDSLNERICVTELHITQTVPATVYDLSQTTNLGTTISVSTLVVKPNTQIERWFNTFFDELSKTWGVHKIEHGWRIERGPHVYIFMELCKFIDESAIFNGELLAHKVVWVTEGQANYWSYVFKNDHEDQRGRRAFVGLMTGWFG